MGPGSHVSHGHVSGSTFHSITLSLTVTHLATHYAVHSCLELMTEHGCTPQCHALHAMHHVHSRIWWPTGAVQRSVTHDLHMEAQVHYQQCTGLNTMLTA